MRLFVKRVVQSHFWAFAAGLQGLAVACLGSRGCILMIVIIIDCRLLFFIRLHLRCYHYCHYHSLVIVLVLLSSLLSCNYFRVGSSSSSLWSFSFVIIIPFVVLGNLIMQLFSNRDLSQRYECRDRSSLSSLCLIRFSLSSHAVCFWVGRAPRLSLLASANGCERDLVGKSLLRLFVHPLDAFRVWIRVGSFFVKIDFDGFRAAVELFLHVGTVSVTCLKSKIWQKRIMIFWAKFDRFLMPKKVIEPNGCRFSLTFESRLRRRGVRRAQWLHVFPQK